jgi:hypothetical protein
MCASRYAIMTVVISLRDAGPHDIEDLLRIDRSIATDRVLTVEVSGPAPEHGVVLRWEPTKPVGAMRTPEFALRRGFALAGFNDSSYRNGDRELQRAPGFLGIAVFLYWPAS